ncbi:transposase domain-containing protein [Cupriavidus metallidurans]|uniref:transposase domain-containing protein n=1 Tax=Cupriavidus TaxID=106589 RepID=UPI00257ACE96|nr:MULTISPECIES: transposase domain-containing protein [unclassified Cupriavidus]
MLSEQIHATLELAEPASFARLSEHLPAAWIGQALAATGTASVRRHRLPAEKVAWLLKRSLRSRMLTC